MCNNHRVLNYVEAFLKNMGLPAKAQESDDPTVEDHSVDIGERIHVSVASYGDTYMMVGVWLDSETMFTYPERLSLTEIYSDIMDAKARYGL